MNRLANLAVSVGETLIHEAGRLLFGIALGRAKVLLGTPPAAWNPATGLESCLAEESSGLKARGSSRAAWEP